MQTVTRFNALKRSQQKISMVTCYDFWSAQLVADSGVDSILVGDSLAVVMHGFPSTVHATLELMLPHVAAVARGAGNKIIVADMPFMTASSGLEAGVAAATALIQAGAHVVKIEGKPSGTAHSAFGGGWNTCYWSSWADATICIATRWPSCSGKINCCR